jgi:CHAD domain-containing protein
VIEVSASVGSEPEGRRATDPLSTLGLTRGPGDLVDAVLAVTGESLGGNQRSPAVPLHRRDDALDAFRAVLRNLLGAAIDNLPGTLADLDPEFLHDLRVALRRTRSVLTEGKDVLPSDVRDRFRTGFADLSAATGHARDLDVYVLTWPETIAAVGLDDPSIVAPLRDKLDRRRATAHSQLAKVLRSKATVRLLESWQTWLEDPDVLPPYDGNRPIGAHVASRIGKAQARLVRDGRAITPDCPAERLHDLRKDAKKLRYLFECFGSVLPAKGRKAFVARLRGLQDNLGLHQDAEIQVAELRALAHELHASGSIGPDVLLAVGRIIDHLERIRQRERAAFAAHFAAYDTRDNRALLDTLLVKAATC